MIEIDQHLREMLKKGGISMSQGSPFMLPLDCAFESPCSLKWMQVEFMLRLGAFSYAVSGHYFGAVIGRYVSIGENVSVGRGSHPVSWASTSPVFYGRLEDVLEYSTPEHAKYRFTTPYIPPKPTNIGSDVYIGHGAFVMQGVNIGNGAVIGAHSVVTKDVPDYAVVAGSPAVIKKMRFPDPMIERMLKIAWWQYAVWDFADLNISDPKKFLDNVESRIADGIKPYAPRPISLADLLRV